MTIRCYLFGHFYDYNTNSMNGLCVRCGWFEHGPNPNAHTRIKQEEQG